MNDTVDTKDSVYDYYPLSKFFVTQLTAADTYRYTITIESRNSSHLDGQDYSSLFIKKIA